MTVLSTACTKTRNAGTPRNTGKPRNTPEHRNSRKTSVHRTKFDGLVFFPITDHVKYEMSVQLV